MFSTVPYWYVTTGPTWTSASVPMLQATAVNGVMASCPMPSLPPTVTVEIQHPEQAVTLNEPPRCEKGEGNDDLCSLDSIMNFSLSAVLPANFGFADEDGSGDSVSKERGWVVTDSPTAMIGRLDGQPTADYVWPDAALSRPAYSYSELIELALRDQGEMTVRSIYTWIKKHFDFYRHSDPRKWQPSVRHTLTISPAFAKVKKVRGGNLWGYVSEQDQVQLRQLKNHWKKQKIAEYEKTSKKKRRVTVGTREPTASKNKMASIIVLPSQSPGEVTLKIKSPAAPKRSSSSEVKIKFKSPAASKRGSLEKAKTLPGKKLRRTSPLGRVKKTVACRKTILDVFEPEDPVPETITTSRGRNATKVDYLTFSKIGKKQQQISKEVLSKAERSSDSKSDDMLEEKESGSETSEDDIEGDHRNILSDSLFEDDEKEEEGCCIRCPTSCCPHASLTPVASLTSTHATSPVLSTPLIATRTEPQIQTLFPTIDTQALGDLSTESLLSEPKKMINSESPGSFLVCDLQDFEPSESAERILASTSLLSFPSTTEAALILSSLENSPHIHQTSGLSLLCQASENAESGLSRMSSLDSSKENLVFDSSQNEPSDSEERSSEVLEICDLQESDITDAKGVKRTYSSVAMKRKPPATARVKVDVFQGRKPAATSPVCTCGPRGADVPESSPVSVPSASRCPSTCGALLNSSAGSSPECMPLYGLASPTLHRMLPFPPAPWMMMGPMPAPMMIDLDEFLPNQQVLHDVPLSDAWDQQSCQNCCCNGTTTSPLAAPKFSHMPSPFGVRSGWRPPFPRGLCPRPIPRGPPFPSFLHPVAPSPVRPDQTAQAAAPPIS